MRILHMFAIPIVIIRIEKKEGTPRRLIHIGILKFQQRPDPMMHRRIAKDFTKRVTRFYCSNGMITSIPHFNSIFIVINNFSIVGVLLNRLFGEILILLGRSKTPVPDFIPHFIIKMKIRIEWWIFWIRRRNRIRFHPIRTIFHQ